MINAKNRDFYIEVAEKFLEGKEELFQSLDAEERAEFLHINNLTIPTDFCIELGVTKAVLVPEEEEYDKVIKVPVYGRCFEVGEKECICPAEKRKAKQLCGECLSEGDYLTYECRECEYFREKLVDMYEYYEEIFHHPTCICASNYCEIEEIVYKQAEEVGLEKFFAKTEFLHIAKDGIPVYLQEKVYATQDSVKGYTPKANAEFKTISGREDVRLLTSHFAKVIIDYYGLDDLIELVNFLSQQGLNDFHSNNLGYREDGSPVIFDYSGFNNY